MDIVFLVIQHRGTVVYRQYGIYIRCCQQNIAGFDAGFPGKIGGRVAIAGMTRLGATKFRYRVSFPTGTLFPALSLRLTSCHFPRNWLVVKTGPAGVLVRFCLETSMGSMPFRFTFWASALP